MRRWKPVPSARLWVGVALLALATFGAVFFAVRVGAALFRPPEQWPIDAGLYAQFVAGVLLLLLACLLIYRVVGALTLAYGVDRNGLYIFWLGNRAIVPLSQIETIESGLSLPADWRQTLQSVGYYHGHVKLPEGRLLHRFSSQPLDRALILHTGGDSYAISPQDAEAFVQELEQRRRLGAIQQLSSGVEVGRMFFYAFWEDRVVRWGLVSALVLNVIVLGILAAVYPDLPAVIELRADAAGAAAGINPRHQVLFLPLAALVVSLLNIGLGMTVYSREPLGARLLQLASVLAQVLFAVAILTIVR